MHARIYREFERIGQRFRESESILEIGATPSEQSLLNLYSLNRNAKKTGVDLDGPHQCPGFYVHQGDANDLTRLFAENSFDLVFCNAVLEHDKFFWKTLAEIRRVTAPGGWVVIGTPGYGMPSFEKTVKRARKSAVLKPFRGFRLIQTILQSTPTLPLHSWPGDYYRFSRDTFEQVFFYGLEEVEIQSFLIPPRFIGVGRIPRE